MAAAVVCDDAALRPTMSFFGKRKKTGSNDTTNTTNTTRTVDTQLTRNSSAANGEKRPEDDAPEMSPEELLTHRKCTAYPNDHWMHGS